MMKDILATIQNGRGTGDIFLYWFVLQSNGHFSLVHRLKWPFDCESLPALLSSAVSHLARLLARK